MHRVIKLSFVLMGLGFGVATWGAAPRAALMQPAVSPDASRIVFVADGVLWIVPATGGTARILVSDKGPDSRPLFSPDGRQLAFESTATGNGDVYLLNLAQGTLERLTYSDAPDRPSGFSRDGQWLYFTSARDNIGGMGAVYRVRVSGGTPMPVSLELYRNEEEGVPSPDDRTLALVGEGWGSTQWWRHGHAHIDDGAIWLLQNNGSHAYRRLTPDDARALWPMWAADGQSLYYMSDRSGADNIWQVNLSSTEHAITHFTDGRALWPTISANGKLIAFQRGWNIWTLDAATGAAHELPITLGGAVAGPDMERKTFSKDFEDLVLSPDGKKLAFIAHGDVFATASDSPGPAERVTHTPAAEFELNWGPKSRRIVYVSERDGHDHLFLYDFKTDQERRLTSGNVDDLDPQFSPDGQWIAFIRDARQLELLNVTSGALRTLASGELGLHYPLGRGRSFIWSPDSRWVAFMQWGARMYRNAAVVPIAGGPAQTVSFLGNTFSGDPWWSPDGKALYFDTGQRTEQGEVAEISLVPQAPQFRREKFLGLFNEPSAPAPLKSGTTPASVTATGAAMAQKQPVQVSVDFSNIATRLKLLPVGLDVQSIALSADGKTLLLTAVVAGHTNLYTWPLDPLALKPPVAHQITATAGDKSDAQFSPDGKTVWYLEDGQVRSVAVKGGEAKAFATSADMDIDFSAEKQVVFNEAWRWLGENFHNPKMNGVNWEAVHTEYAPLVAGAANPATLHLLLGQMVGELDSSHSGVRGPEKPVMITGRLGLTFDPAAYWDRGVFKISRVIPLGPAALSGKITVGDRVLAVDGAPLSAASNLDALFANRIGKETVLSVARDAAGSGRHDVKVKPVSSPELEQLVYDAWVEDNRAFVAKLSGGKLGYVDLPDMSEDSLHELYQAINAINGTREGVVIDIRNNYGGFVNAYALDTLARQPYLNMSFRGMQTVSARPVLGQRALERPTVLITNRITLSDGEDFTEGYEELGLGKVVGEPTAGWIIYTSNVKLIDGATVRLPFITVTTEDGQPMEMHPRPVNVLVKRPLGDSYRGMDPQLEAAVHTLLNQIQAPGAAGKSGNRQTARVPAKAAAGYAPGTSPHPQED
ncbi:MAG: S41 family peptidase [Gammaproteobacteria bacterium]